MDELKSLIYFIKSKVVKYAFAHNLYLKVPPVYENERVALASNFLSRWYERKEE